MPKFRLDAVPVRMESRLDFQTWATVKMGRPKPVPDQTKLT